MRCFALLFLAFALACQPVTAPAPEPERLPPIPDSVETALGPLTVVWEDSLRNTKSVGLYGGLAIEKRIIYLNRFMTNLAVAWQTLEHERCHAVLFETGLRYLVSDSVQETLCDAWATQRVLEMRAAARRP